MFVPNGFVSEQKECDSLSKAAETGDQATVEALLKMGAKLFPDDFSVSE